MRLYAIIAAAVIGGSLSFFTHGAQAMPKSTAPVDISQSSDVQNVHGRHCRIIRGHRSRCRRYGRRGHAHSHWHRGYRHYHYHYGGHHRRYRPYRRHYRPYRRYYRY